MVSPSLILGGASLLLSVAERKKRQEIADQVNDETTDSENVDMPFDMEKQSEIAQGQDRTAEAVERLAEIESTQQAGPEDKDAFSSTTITLQDGETVVVTVEPAEGFHLRVRRIYFDRRDNHDYQLNVAGDVTSVSHRAKYVKPKLVSQSDRVTAQATNNSGSETTLDFEMEAWAEKP